MTMALQAEAIDPIAIEVIRNKLDGIANEMQLTLVRSAFSAIVKEGLTLRPACSPSRARRWPRRSPSRSI